MKWDPGEHVIVNHVTDRSSASVFELRASHLLLINFTTTYYRETAMTFIYICRTLGVELVSCSQVD